MQVVELLQQQHLMPGVYRPTTAAMPQHILFCCLLSQSVSFCSAYGCCSCLKHISSVSS
jgi:hypothetical protein